MEEKKNVKNWIVILLLIIFFPVGLYLMWAKTAWNKNLKTVITIAVIILAIISVANINNNVNNVGETHKEPTAESTVETTESKTQEIELINVIDMNATKAEAELKKLGFKKISLAAHPSSSSKHIIDSSNWVVVGQTPKCSTTVKSNTEITLTCKKENEAEQDKENDLINQLKDKPLIEVISKLEDLGYTPTYKHEVSKYNYSEEIAAFDDKELSKWIVTDIGSINIDDKTITVYINTSENVANAKINEEKTSKLNSKLDVNSAWRAVNDYGKAQYSYGFKLHYLIKKEAEKVQDENTWFLKAKATVTNEYGVKAEYDCEAYVTGTTENPIVKNFNIY